MRFLDKINMIIYIDSYRRNIILDYKTKVKEIVVEKNIIKSIKINSGKRIDNIHEETGKEDT